MQRRHLARTIESHPHPAIILRQRSPRLRRGLPKKDPCTTQHRPRMQLPNQAVWLKSTKWNRIALNSRKAAKEELW